MEIALEKGGTRRRVERAFRVAIAWGVIGVVSLVVLWACYGFRFQARPADRKMDPPLAQHASGIASAWQRGMILWIAGQRLLPQAYLYGLADVAIASEGRPTNLLGKVYPQGQWFYFPAAFVIKSSLGLMGLLVLLPVARLLGGAGKQREILILAIPPALYMAASLASRLNIGWRHILAVYPFLIILAAAGQYIERRGIKEC